MTSFLHGRKFLMQKKFATWYEKSKMERKKWGRSTFLTGRPKGKK
uniref:Uncharacterized protein n=1 Tax=viral metagenome TaxID=1070528 RepID=A0A6C0CH92_9ZZZZ